EADTALWLATCLDSLNQNSNVIGESLGLWKPIAQHPAVLALAVKTLLARQRFLPAPCELRAAMLEVQDKLRSLRLHAWAWLKSLVEIDELLFARDRAAWRAAYERLGGEVALAMTGYIDDKSPRAAELYAVCDAKDRAEAKLASIEPAPAPLRV